MPDFRLRIGMLFARQDRVLTIEQMLPDGRLGLEDDMLERTLVCSTVEQTKVRSTYQKIAIVPGVLTGAARSSRPGSE